MLGRQDERSVQHPIILASLLFLAWREGKDVRTLGRQDDLPPPVPSSRHPYILTLVILAFSCAVSQPADVDQMLPAGPHRLHVVVRGRGPAVVLESGFGGTAESWERVQPEVARFARVVAYDRAGLGRSESGPAPRTAAQIALELRTALRAANIAPPYVLVAHSAGGAYARVFAHLYPGEVAGMVLIDPPQEGLLAWLKVNHPEADAIPPARLAQMPAGMRAEWEARDAVIEELRGAWPLPEVPVVLVTSARNDESLAQGVSPEAKAVLLEARQRWLARVAGARQIVAERSGHDIPHDEPELVVDAIRQVLAARRR
jgi:pimeloyl-ACP methyl ester carboxylesterase